MNKTVEPIFHGYRYHLQYFGIDDNLYRELRAKLDGRRAQYCGDPCSTDCDVIFVQTPSNPQRHTYRALTPADDIHFEEFRHTGRWEFDSICTHLGRRAKPGLDPLMGKRKRVVDIGWINYCIREGRGIVENFHDEWEVLTRDKVLPPRPRSTIRSTSGILTPLTPNTLRSPLRSCLAKVAVDPRLKRNVKFGGPPASNRVDAIPIVNTPPSPPLTASDATGDFEMAVGDMSQITSAARAFPVVGVGEIADGPSPQVPIARQANVASEDPTDIETSIASSADITFASPPVEDCEMPAATACEDPELPSIPDNASGQTDLLSDITEDFDMAEEPFTEIALARPPTPPIVLEVASPDECMEDNGSMNPCDLAASPHVDALIPEPPSLGDTRTDSFGSSSTAISRAPQIFERMAQHAEGFYIACSDMSSLSRVITNHGGLLGSPQNARFVIINFDHSADNDFLEADVLEALAEMNTKTQLPISHQWIEACVEAGKVLDMTPYVIPLPKDSPIRGTTTIPAVSGVIYTQSGPSQVSHTPIDPPAHVLAVPRAHVPVIAAYPMTPPQKRSMPACPGVRTFSQPIFITRGLTPPPGPKTNAAPSPRTSKRTGSTVKRISLQSLEDLIHEFDDWLRDPARVRRSKTVFLQDLRKRRPENRWTMVYYNNRKEIRQELINRGHSRSSLSQAGINAASAE